MNPGLNSVERTARRDLTVLAICLLAAYGSSLVGSLVADDLMLLRNVRNAEWSFGELSRAFHIGCEDLTDGWMSPRMEQYRLAFFRPVCSALLKADLLLWGDWGPGYHLTNLLLQLIVVFLVYAWGRDFGFDRSQRFLMALFFTIYVPNMLAVSWVSGRTELISAALILTSVMALGKFHGTGNPLHFTVSFAAYLLAMGTKENAVIIPFLHILSALLLYKDTPRSMKSKAVAILPFLAILPLYFMARSWALGGFPLPPKSFYYHPVNDPEFIRFALVKISHTILTLVYQLPSFVLPVFLERSFPALLLMAFGAVATLMLLARWVKGPLRYFILGWIVIALAPTLPIGLNPVYYYLSSPVIAALYVLLYGKFASSPIQWQVRAAKLTLKSAIVAGFILCALSGPIIRFGGDKSRRVAQSALEILQERPGVETVYLFDISGSCLYLVPEIRFANSAYEDVEFHLMNLNSAFLGSAGSEMTQLDGRSFECRPTTGSYFSTGLEQVFFAQEIIDFQAGMKVRHDDYEIEIAEVEPNYNSRDEWALSKALRNHFRLPGKKQVGVTKLRYRFDSPLESEGRIFLGVDAGQVKEIDFRSQE